MRGTHATDELITYLIGKAREIIPVDDPSHDIDHALRVLANAELISVYEGGDRDIITPSALLHDAIVYPKDDPRSDQAVDESARVAGEILQAYDRYPQEKIAHVKQAIREHSFSRGIRPQSLESKIIQDADRLEATGAIAIMRTFCSTGQMKRSFYCDIDPFCQVREPGNYAIDLFYARLLKVADLMNTPTAKGMAVQRTRFMHDFLEQVRKEITSIKRYKATTYEHV